MGFRTGEFPKVERYYAEAISLLMFQTMSEAQQDAVVAALNSILVS